MKRFALQRPPSLSDLPNELEQWFDQISRFSRSITTSKTVTAAYSVESEVYWVRVDCTSGAITVTLPPVGNVGRPIGIVKVDSSANAVTVDGDGSDTLSGTATQTLSAQADVIVVRDNGTSWDIEVRVLAQVTTMGGLTPTDGNFIVGDGTTWVSESGSTARTSLGLGTIATQNSNNVTITGGAISGITDLAVADGGTGSSTAAGARTNLDVPSNAEAILDTLIAAKGDLIVGNANDTPAILSVGTDGHVLTADAASTNGVKWAAGGGSAALDDLTDVTITTPGDGQVLTFDSGTGEWVNEASAAGFSNPMTTAGDIIKGGTGGAAERLGIGSNGQVLTVSSGAPAWAAAGGGGLYSAYIHLRDEKAQNTSGGTFTSGAWQTRTLNTESSDTGGDCSLASNQFTLSAGTYRIHASAPAYQVVRNQLRLQNVTDTATLLVGQVCVSANGVVDQNIAELRGRFTIAASKALELQHRCATTFATQGFGVESNLTTEVYAEVELWKES